MGPAARSRIEAELVDVNPRVDRTLSITKRRHLFGYQYPRAACSPTNKATAYGVAKERAVTTITGARALVESIAPLVKKDAGC
jgi:hypothetical protein